MRKYISDEDVSRILKTVISSFPGSSQKTGLPLGNLTSQLFVNIYMNEFDQFVKHKLKAKYYIRYADDFVFVSNDRNWLEEQISAIDNFLRSELKLALHPQKVSIKTLYSGVDFLGWVHFSDHRILRNSTKRRMLKRIKVNCAAETLASYLGLLGHGNAGKVKNRALELYLENDNIKESRPDIP